MIRFVAIEIYVIIKFLCNNFEKENFKQEIYKDFRFKFQVEIEQ